jgi:hypothetical protein
MLIPRKKRSWAIGLIGALALTVFAANGALAYILNTINYTEFIIQTSYTGSFVMEGDETNSSSLHLELTQPLTVYDGDFRVDDSMLTLAAPLVVVPSTETSTGGGMLGVFDSSLYMKRVNTPPPPPPTGYEGITNLVSFYSNSGGQLVEDEAVSFTPIRVMNFYNTDQLLFNVDSLQIVNSALNFDFGDLNFENYILTPGDCFLLGTVASLSNITLTNVTTNLSDGWALYTFEGSAGLALGYQLQPVPEPSTFLLLGAGLVGLGVLMARKRKSPSN